MKARVAAPFAAVAKKKMKPGASGRPGGPNGNGRPVSAKNSGGAALRRPTAQPTPHATRPRDTEVRDAQLVVARIEPFSVMKFSFIVSIVGWAALLVIVALCFFMLSALGVFHSIEHTVGLVTSVKGSPGSNASSWFSAGTVLGFTMIAGAIDVVIITALATIGAVIYNWVARLTGGVEVTLAEAD